MTTIRDEKYIVFKREEFNKWLIDTFGPTPRAEGRLIGIAEALSLDDAVVIRTKDPFAGPALHCYAATMAMYTNLSNINGDPAKSLRRTADYFNERAMEADATFEQKLPD